VVKDGIRFITANRIDTVLNTAIIAPMRLQECTPASASSSIISLVDESAVGRNAIRQ
jgi:hypothetical protein